eukprot:jgi/Mesvir1/17169/Mv07591-RA.1
MSGSFGNRAGGEDMGASDHRDSAITQDQDGFEPTGRRVGKTAAVVEAEEAEADDLAEFEEILNTEMHVDMKRLRELSRGGVPAKIRGRVWMYLLGVSQPDRCKGEVKRFRSHWTAETPGLQSLLERTLCSYLGYHAHVEYNPRMVYLLAPLLHCLRKESDIFYCFQALMMMLEPRFTTDNSGSLGVAESSRSSSPSADELSSHQQGGGSGGGGGLTVTTTSINQEVSKFMTIFRTIQPELYNFFEDEELEPSMWAAPWLQTLLCRELPLPCVLRLWDTYFSGPEGFNLHPYVCLTELLGFLMHLPGPDMDQVIAKAYNVREQVLSWNII